MYHRSLTMHHIFLSSPGRTCSGTKQHRLLQCYSEGQQCHRNSEPESSSSLLSATADRHCQQRPECRSPSCQSECFSSDLHNRQKALTIYHGKPFLSPTFFRFVDCLGRSVGRRPEIEVTLSHSEASLKMHSCVPVL